MWNIDFHMLNMVNFPNPGGFFVAGRFFGRQEMSSCETIFNLASTMVGSGRMAKQKQGPFDWRKLDDFYTSSGHLSWKNNEGKSSGWKKTLHDLTSSGRRRIGWFLYSPIFIWQVEWTYDEIPKFWSRRYPAEKDPPKSERLRWTRWTIQRRTVESPLFVEHFSKPLLSTTKCSSPFTTSCNIQRFCIWPKNPFGPIFMAPGTPHGTYSPNHLPTTDFRWDPDFWLFLNPSFQPISLIAINIYPINPFIHWNLMISHNQQPNI